MEVGYEEKYDILGIIIPNAKYTVERTVEVDGGFLLDVDKNDNVVQIEIHNICNRIDVSPDYIKRAKVDVYIEPYEFTYVIIISFNDGEKEIKRRILRGREDEDL